MRGDSGTHINNIDLLGGDLIHYLVVITTHKPNLFLTYCNMSVYYGLLCCSVDLAISLKLICLHSLLRILLQQQSKLEDMEKKLKEREKQLEELRFLLLSAQLHNCIYLENIAYVCAIKDIQSK